MPAPLGPGADLYLRWADDNVAGPGGETAAENVWSVDNVRLAMTMVPQPGILLWNRTGADAKWTTAANWGGQNPVAGKQLTFGAPASGEPSNTNDFSPGTLFGGITFAGDAPTYDLQGNAIKLAGPVENLSARDQAIGLDMELVSGGGSLDDGGKALTLSGSLSGIGPLVKSGEGTVILSGANTYSGGTVIEGGTLEITDPHALPADGSLTVLSGRVVLQSGLGHAVELSGLSISLGAAPAPVPEPSTLALLGAGALGLAVCWRRRHGLGISGSGRANP